jgi:hypothetical protein
MILALVASVSACAAEAIIPWRSGPEPLVDGGKSIQHGPVVLQLSRNPSQAERTDLAQDGLHLLDYLGGGVWFARSTGEKSAFNSSLVEAIAPVAAEWKLHPALRYGDMPAYAVLQDDAKSVAPRYAVGVRFFSDIDDGSARAIAAGYGMDLWSAAPSIHTLQGALPAQAVFAMAADPGVQWIEPAAPALEPNNDGVRSGSQAHALQGNYYGLDGSGIAVLVYDSGMADAHHPDFGGRLTAREPDQEIESHPTHVAGTIGGSGAQSVQFGGTRGQWRGMAPAVRLESFEYDRIGIGEILFADMGDFEDDYRIAINELGVDVANNSLGSNVSANGYPCELHGDYGLMSELIDATVTGALGRPLPIIFSAGNERGSGRCGLTHGTLAPPAAAKNSLVVGAAASDTGEIANFSGWGPSDDGRIKPDLSAPGTQTSADFGVTSTQADGGYTVKSGTSMAAPAVTGAVALWLQQWRRLFGAARDPAPALIKAVFLQTAEDRGETGPDYQYGYGMLRAQSAVNLLIGGTWAEGEVADGGAVLYLMRIERGASELRATLAWDDVPGAPNVTPALVNDLDLVAVSPSGAVHYPWTLDPADPVAPAQRDQPDRANNVEQVFVDRPEPGVWQLRIFGHSIPLGPQRYGLAAWPDLRQCSDTAVLLFTAPAVSCSGEAQIVVADCARDSLPDVQETVMVRITSNGDDVGQEVSLLETAPNSGVFTGVAGQDVSVAHGGSITATYMGADGTLAMDNVVVDCVAPAVNGVAVDASTVRAAITFNTDEAARVTAYYGADCGAATQMKAGARFDTEHTFVLDDLEPDTVYALYLEVMDRAGNVSRVDNGGACILFKTAFRPDYHTEFFLEGEFDLANSTVRFTPDGSASGYRAEFIRNVFLLPDDPADGERLALGDDDATAIRLPAGRSLPLFGVDHDRFRIGSNGYINPVRNDTIQTPSLTSHFIDPRISLLFNDLDPSEATGSGRVLYAEYADRIAVSWVNVQQWDMPDLRNTGQLRWFDNGVIELTWTTVQSEPMLAGLSRGMGAPFDFAESDFSAYGLDGLILNVPSVVRGRENATLRAVIGADSPRRAPSISVEGLPVDANFRDRGDGTGAFDWFFAFGEAGRYGPFTATADDGDATVSRSFLVEIALTANAPPIARELRVLPAPALEGDDLRAVWDYVDPEGYPEGPPSIFWTRNGAAVPGLNGLLEIPAVFTRAGDRWSFAVRPNDGRVLGEVAHSPAVLVRHRFDLTGDGLIDSTDLQRVINIALGGHPGEDGDINGDGVVDAIDVQTLVVALLAA